LLVLFEGGSGHGGHESTGPLQGETIQQYAQRHMSSEHHIDSFDIRSFFQLHDLNRNGFWDKDEIEAVYGVHHVYSQKQSKDELEHQEKADHIVKVVLERLDLDGDGRITAEELEKVGLDGLPNFEGLGADGHHTMSKVNFSSIMRNNFIQHQKPRQTSHTHILRIWNILRNTNLLSIKRPNEKRNTRGFLSS